MTEGTTDLGNGRMVNSIGRTALVGLAALAVIGFVLSAVVHGLALAGVAPPLPQATVMMTLHLGIFVVFVPAVFVGRRFASDGRRIGLFDILRAVPVWMAGVLVVVLAYAIVNFLLVFALRPSGGAPDAIDTLRGFSGHWMAFYTASFAIHYTVLTGGGRARDTARDLRAG